MPEHTSSPNRNPNRKTPNRNLILLRNPDSSDSGTPSFLHGACAKCANRSTCKKPCPFVEAILSDGNKAAIECNVSDDIRILFPHHRETRETELIGIDDKGTAATAEVFSTRNKELWDDLLSESDADAFQQLQTRVFWGMLFNGATHDDLMVQFDTDRESIKNAYRKAKQRLISVARAMDRQEFACLQGGRELQRFPRWLEVYLLYTLIGMRESEIIRFLGIRRDAVQSAYAKAKRYIAAGRVNLLDIVDADQGGAGKAAKAPKSGAEYLQEAMDLIRSGRVNSRRQAAVIFAERDGVDLERIEGMISGHVTRSKR